MRDHRERAQITEREHRESTERERAKGVQRAQREQRESSERSKRDQEKNRSVQTENEGEREPSRPCDGKPTVNIHQKN